MFFVKTFGNLQFLQSVYVIPTPESLSAGIAFKSLFKFVDILVESIGSLKKVLWRPFDWDRFSLPRKALVATVLIHRLYLFLQLL